MSAEKDTDNRKALDNTPLGDPVALGRVVTQARLERGWSIRELGKRSGVHYSHIAALEKGGVRRPAPDILRKLAQSLQLEIEDLYVYAGYTIGDALPGLEPYLRARYDMAPQAIAELHSFFAYIRQKYSPDPPPGSKGIVDKH